MSPQARDMLEEEGGGDERRGKEQQHIFGEIVKVALVVLVIVVVAVVAAHAVVTAVVVVAVVDIVAVVVDAAHLWRYSHWSMLTLLLFLLLLLLLLQDILGELCDIIVLVEDLYGKPDLHRYSVKKYSDLSKVTQSCVDQYLDSILLQTIYSSAHQESLASMGLPTPQVNPSAISGFLREVVKIPCISVSYIY